MITKKLEIEHMSKLFLDTNFLIYSIDISSKYHLWTQTILTDDVMLQMKMEFPKLTVRENLGEENEKKKTVHR
ncbi:MAG: hypothetical protein SCALA702_38140 [Melioribacteraceae bacterium]|nr:MAG: hypothetical protein SCALA702_38140 [Melioribacteraceae bacterium]